jgi:hypothetical protein
MTLSKPCNGSHPGLPDQKGPALKKKFTLCKDEAFEAKAGAACCVQGDQIQQTTAGHSSPHLTQPNIVWCCLWNFAQVADQIGVLWCPMLCHWSSSASGGALGCLHLVRPCTPLRPRSCLYQSVVFDLACSRRENGDACTFRASHMRCSSMSLWSQCLQARKVLGSFSVLVSLLRGLGLLDLCLQLSPAYLHFLDRSTT